MVFFLECGSITPGANPHSIYKVFAVYPFFILDDIGMSRMLSTEDMISMTRAYVTVNLFSLFV